MVSFTRCFLGCLLLGAAVAGGTVQAQTFVQSEKSEVLMQREMDAFLDPDITTIPVEGRSVYKEAKEEKAAIDGKFAKVYPISTNPQLAEKMAVTGRQNANNGVEDLTVAGEFNLGWGTINTVEDGKQYFFTQEFEKSVPNGLYQSYYRSVTYRIYNDELEEIKSFKVASSDSTFSFSLCPDVSTKVFNNDSEWEFMVQIHSFEGVQHIQGPEACRDTLVIVNENSELLNRFNWSSGAMIDKIKSGFNYKYNLGIVEPYYSGLSENQVMRYYDPKQIGTELDVLPEPLFVYDMPIDLLTYTRGIAFSLCDLEDEQFYVSAHYEKPFVANGNQQDPEYEMNNKYIIKLYDTSFNFVKEIKLPLIGQADHEVSMSVLGDFYDFMMTKNVFNDDDKYEIIYGMSRYYAECDCEKVDYYLVNEDGEILKEMLKQSGGAMKLQEINGQGDQYAVLMGSSDGVTSIKMYNMPEMEEVFTFPALHNGELLSMAFNRVPVGDSYNYVFGLGRGEITDNTVYGGIAYYDKNGKMTKRVRIDVGQNAALFSPILDSSTLNPYTFIADDKNEYAYFAKVYTEDGSVSSQFGIADENEVLYLWSNTVDESLAGAGIMMSSDGLKYNKFFLQYMSVSLEDFMAMSTRFYNLPLKPVALQGDGTEHNPFKISNPAELDMIRDYPDAWFELVSDIDMINYTGVAGQGFTQIASFSGNLDGNNHVIKNVEINPNGNINIGLFSFVQNGVIKNLQLENILINNATLGNIGSIAGRIAGSRIENCHVINGMNVGSKVTAAIGGLIGEAASYSYIANCSYIGDIVAPSATAIGGIAGKLSTSSIISNSYSEGSLAGKSNVGGVVGSLMSNARVENCYSEMSILGISRIGGIIGDGNGVVKNNYALGIVSGELREGEKWIQNAGGIAGAFSGSMTGECLMSNNIALNEKVVMPEKFARLAFTDNLKLLKNNYALASMLIGPDSENLATVDESDETTVGLDKIHGKSVTKEELNQAFYEALGWSFGTDSVSPWVMTDEYPRLWHEFVVRGVKLDVNELTLGKGEKYTLTPEIFPADATNKNVRYSSSDMKVAAVSATGEITARGTGEADITVTTEEGSYKAVCHVTVVIPVEQVIISQEEVKVGVNEYVELSATVLPEDATNKKIVWVVENTGIAYMIESNVVGLAPGVTNVIAMTEDGEVSDTCAVTVVAPVEDLYLEETMISLDKKNPTHQLVARLVPETSEATLVWETEDAGIAEVDQNGLVTGHRKGEIIVTVSTDDHLFSAECLVEVTEDIDISVDMNAIEGTRVFAEEGSIVVLSEAEVTGVQVSDAAGTLVYADFATEGSRIVVPSAEWTSGAYIVKVLFGNGDSRVYKVVL